MKVGNGWVEFRKSLSSKTGSTQQRRGLRPTSAIVLHSIESELTYTLTN